jgi:hypothetical protein
MLDLMRALPIFKHLGEAELARLAGQIHERQLNASNSIMR